MLVNDIITRVAIELVDPKMVRWHREDLISYLSDAVSAIAMRRPSLFSKNIRIESNESPINLPDDCFQLLVVDSINDISAQYVLIEKLNQFNPYWRKEKGIPTCWTKHDNETTKFWLYPQPLDVVSISIQYAKTPIVNEDTTIIALPNIFFGALVDFILYRAFSRDSENPTESAKSQLHFQSFILFMNDSQTLKSMKDNVLNYSTTK
ncbi:phage adaptor protein [Photobacterium damselae]|uniref:phage adaptor protein n=1 Tax=Photobacterium damselae TaxID=38293 RepID=UPI002543C647